jgi:hypothetical protein
MFVFKLTGWLRLGRYTAVLLLLLVAGCADVAPDSRVSPPTVATPAAVPLDVNTLKTRITATKAIGTLTKISLQNQVDDLMQQFREHYGGKATRPMSDLRQSYTLLLMKVLSLLQDTDQKLASDILSSREAIWGLLSDQTKFANL